MSNSGFFQENWFYKTVAYTVLAIVAVVIAFGVLTCIAAFLIVAGITWITQRFAVKSMSLALFLMTAFDDKSPLYNRLISFISIMVIIFSVLGFLTLLFGPMFWVSKSILS